MVAKLGAVDDDGVGADSLSSADVRRSAGVVVERVGKDSGKAEADRAPVGSLFETLRPLYLRKPCVAPGRRKDELAASSSPPGEAPSRLGKVRSPIGDGEGGGGASTSESRSMSFSAHIVGAVRKEGAWSRLAARPDSLLNRE